MMTDRVGDVIGSQGLYARTLDFARFGELFRNGGRTPRGRQVVPAAWVRASTTMTGTPTGEYAFQWWHGPTAAASRPPGSRARRSRSHRRCSLTGVRLSHTLGLGLSNGF